MSDDCRSIVDGQGDKRDTPLALPCPQDLLVDGPAEGERAACAKSLNTIVTAKPPCRVACHDAFLAGIATEYTSSIP